VIEQVALTVRDPMSKLTLAATARDRKARQRGSLPIGQSDALIGNRLGSGSDYTVFLNFLGVPVADLSFDGPYGVYHSIYDNHNWVARVGDPGFQYHVTLVQLWGLIALRLADADVIPLDYEPYGQRVEEFAREVGGRWPSAEREPLADVLKAAADFRAAAASFNRARELALSAGDASQLSRLNQRLIAVERAFVDPSGIPGRPWYRHLIYAPKFTYAPELLPGIAEAVDAGDGSRAAVQAGRVTEALKRAAALLDGRAAF
jgi:N-acetylated-alpha-linked acidic dipeptidase